MQIDAWRQARYAFRLCALRSWTLCANISDTTLLKTPKPKLVVEVHHGADRDELLERVEAAGYSRQGIPIEPVEGEIEPQYLEDRSYAFQAT